MMGINGLSGNGYGPWRILAECPARTHNSIRAGIGQKSGLNIRPACICPRALDVLGPWLAARKDAEAARMRTIHHRGDPRTRLQPPMPEPVNRRSPDFTAGLCTTPGGMRAADLGMNDQASVKGIADRQVAKAWCAQCPMLAECRAWVTAEEKPAGSWGGVWGGLDPWNRKGLELVIRQGKAEVIPYVAA